MASTQGDKKGERKYQKCSAGSRWRKKKKALPGMFGKEKKSKKKKEV